MTSRNLAKKIAALAFTKKASDVQLLDLRKVSDVADFFVLCSADSDVQVKAIADAILDGLAESDIHPWHREGITQKQWILLDFIDVVVHVFHTEARKFYGLEKLWGDSQIETLTDTPPVPAKKAPVVKAGAVKSPAVKSPAVKSVAGRKTTAGGKKTGAGKTSAGGKGAAGTRTTAGRKTAGAVKSPAAPKTAARSAAAGKPRAARRPPKK